MGESIHTRLDRIEQAVVRVQADQCPHCGTAAIGSAYLAILADGAEEARCLVCGGERQRPVTRGPIKAMADIDDGEVR